MRSYLVRYLLDNKTHVETINAYSPFEAKNEILSKFKNALILSIRCIDYDNDTRMY